MLMAVALSHLDDPENATAAYEQVVIMIVIMIVMTMMLIMFMIRPSRLTPGTRPWLSTLLCSMQARGMLWPPLSSLETWSKG